MTTSSFGIPAMAEMGERDETVVARCGAKVRDVRGALVQFQCSFEASLLPLQYDRVVVGGAHHVPLGIGLLSFAV